MRDIKIYVRGSTKFKDDNKPGYYEVLLVDCETGQNKWLRKDYRSDTTPNRLMLLGTIEAISILKYSCSILLIPTTSLGFGGKGVNSDLINEIIFIVSDKGHRLVEKPDITEVKNQFNPRRILNSWRSS